ncbi:MAG: HAMP domain-containing protein [Alphaproteobacteria bacterium]|nr:HAMP domain-containing protein [Alphaproteobacteria bacterium]
MKHFLNHPFKAIKAYLPKSMFGRSLLILMAPLVLVETISAYVFFDNHWENVTKALANNIAGEVATITELYNAIPEDSHFFKGVAGTHLKLRTAFIPHKKLNKSVPEEWKDTALDSALKSQIFNPYTFKIKQKDIIITTEVENGLLQFTTPRKRLQSKSFFLFIIWVSATSALFLCISAVFLHNQVKPLRRLAIAAERFGKGRTSPHFKPEGSTEIRKVSQAFLNMKERLQRQLTQKTEMLAGVSHDLRTPLTRMRLQLAMMPLSSETEGLQKDVEEMGKMLEGYLTFARGEGLEETSDTDINGLILEAIKGRMHPEVNVHYTPQELPVLGVKAQALKRCLMNLINNAARYGHEVWVSTSPAPEALTMVIEDDGPGIPEDKFAEVFQPFFRLDGSRNMATGGVGLGLSIARDIAHSHGGDIILSSSKDHGGLKASLVLPY